MKIPGLRLLLATGGSLTLGGAALAATTVNFGTVSAVTGPSSLDLTGNFPYSVNFNGPNKTVGVVEGADINPIWQALTLERVPEPSALGLGAIGMLAWIRRRSR